MVLGLGFFADIARAAELKVLASVALTSALNELGPMYEKATGDKLSIGYGLAAELKKRILDGENADVIILTRPMMDDLQRQDKLAGDGVTNVAGTAVSVVARAGAPVPDISSVDAFKRTLLAARSIVYADPAKGGASGVYFAGVLNRLGLTGELKDKTILVPGAQARSPKARLSSALRRPPKSCRLPGRSWWVLCPENSPARPYSAPGSARRAALPRPPRHSFGF
jgi:molybdate transport system substrate-binding protein